MQWGRWAPYVRVADRRARAEREMARLRKKGRAIEPVAVEGRKITRTFWGNAWCDHLMHFASLANRLDRGRTYVRNGSVCHLEIDAGEVRALVMGSDLYEVKLAVTPLAKARWKTIRGRCGGSVGSLMDLLQGRLSDAVMAVVTDRDQGLFPGPKEFHPDCSCPDYATVCKHVAAVFYGVGARLDERPELLFRLRGVDHRSLVDDEGDAVAALTAGGTGARIDEADLGDVFGIELAEDDPPAATGRPAARGRRGAASRSGPGPRARAATTAAPTTAGRTATTRTDKTPTASPRAATARTAAASTAKAHTSNTRGAKTPTATAGAATARTAAASTAKARTSSTRGAKTPTATARAATARTASASTAKARTSKTRGAKPRTATARVATLRATTAKPHGKTTTRRDAKDRAPAAARHGPADGGGRGSTLPQPLHAKHVLALRERLGLSRAELAALLGMTAAAVGVWERRDAPLAPQPASRDALQRVWRMGRAVARRHLAER